MASQLTSPAFYWRSCGEPSAAWFLVWMPLVLLALGEHPSLSAAMTRLLAVLLVAGFIWARGLGSEGFWSERLFIAVWAAAWAAALGLLVTGDGWPDTRLGPLALGLALLTGAAWLGWVCQLRQELREALAKEPRFGRAGTDGAATQTVLAVWLLCASLFALALATGNAHRADGAVLVLALGSFTAFQRGGLGNEEPAAD